MANFVKCVNLTVWNGIESEQIEFIQCNNNNKLKFSNDIQNDSWAHRFEAILLANLLLFLKKWYIHVSKKLSKTIVYMLV